MFTVPMFARSRTVSNRTPSAENDSSGSNRLTHLVLSELVADFAAVLSAVRSRQTADGQSVNVSVVLYRIVSAVHRYLLAVLVPGGGQG